MVIASIYNNTLAIIAVFDRTANSELLLRSSVQILIKNLRQKFLCGINAAFACMGVGHRHTQKKKKEKTCCLTSDQQNRFITSFNFWMVISFLVLTPLLFSLTAYTARKNHVSADFDLFGLFGLFDQ